MAKEVRKDGVVEEVFDGEVARIPIPFVSSVVRTVFRHADQVLQR